MKQKILIVDDDIELCHLLKRYLENEKYEVDIIHNGKDGKKQFLQNDYHLIILDVMLDDIDGLTLLSELRKIKNTPVLMLSAKGDEMDKVIGLKLGADDYITKPFSLSELTARVESLIRRYVSLGAISKKPQRLVFGKLEIDPNRIQVFYNNQDLNLTGKEFELLYFLALHPNRIFTKKQIYQNVWQDAYAYDDNNIMVHIRRLRKKIEPNPEEPVYIVTSWGVGYKFNGVEMDE